MAWSIQLLVAAITLVVLVAVLCYPLRDDPGQAFVKALQAGELQANRLTWMKTLLRSITAMGEIVAEGYSRSSKRGRLFVLSTLGSGSIVVLPSPLLHILNKPENQVAAFEVQLETWQPRYTIGNKELYQSTIEFAFNIVRKELTKDVGRFAGIMAEELAAGIDNCWGSSEEWITVNVYDTSSQIIARTMSRLFFGMPLCHDQTLLEQSRQYSTSVFGSAAIISTLPHRLQRVLGPLIASPAKRRLAACRKILMPYVEARLVQTRKQEAMCNDVLQSMINEAYQINSRKIDAAHLTQSLLILMLSSIHGTSYGLTNCILDLYSSECCDDYIAGIREECKQVLADGGDLRDRDAVTRLHHIDSCIRESLRISGFTIVSLMRVISATNGLELNDGTKVPKGVRVGVPLQAIHHDPSFYHEPSRFNAFRFSEACKPLQTTSQPLRDAAQSGKRERCVDINERFLTYGFGRHACPGRFFASQMMSLALAYIIQNYDIEHTSKRAKSQSILHILIPPTSATVRIRRRT